MANDVIQTGVIRLRDVIASLRESASFIDEEGEITNDLEALVAALVVAPAQPVGKAFADARDAERYRALRGFIHSRYDATRQESHGLMAFWYATNAHPKGVDELVDGLSAASSAMAAQEDKQPKGGAA